MVRPENPCAKDCENRTAECHAICELYQEYRTQIDAYKAAEIEGRRKHKMLRRQLTNAERKKYKVTSGSGQW